MKFTPAQFKIALAAVAAIVGFAVQYQLIPVEFAGLAATLSTLLSGLVTPPKKDATNG